MGPLIGLSITVGRQLSGSLPRAPEQRDNVASEAETGALIGLSGAVGEYTKPHPFSHVLLQKL